MAGLLHSVDQKTQLVGQNRLELLLFSLDGKQMYGINVFKVREVLQCPELTELPKRHPVIRGVAHIRGGTISIIDLNNAIGNPPIKDLENAFVIITEYNRAVQGFLVDSVLRIVNMNWNQIHTPPAGSGQDNYLTAVTEVDNNIVEIIDVEKVLAEITPALNMELDDDVVLSQDESVDIDQIRVMIVDDSAVARKQIKRCMDKLGVGSDCFENGRLAYEHLRNLELEEGTDINDKYQLMISDIEMPEMDGYTLVAKVRADPNLSTMHVILHTSLSGCFNEAMVKKVGANSFLAKFSPEELAKQVNDHVLERTGIQLANL